MADIIIAPDGTVYFQDPDKQGWTGWTPETVRVDNQGNVYGIDPTNGKDYTVRVWGHIETDPNGREIIVIDKWDVAPSEKEGVLLEAILVEGEQNERV